jgi:hypothetical protein
MGKLVGVTLLVGATASSVAVSVFRGNALPRVVYKVADPAI